MFTKRIVGAIGMGLCVCLLGCGPGTGGKSKGAAQPSGSAPGAAAGADGHDHLQAGPHGGHLIELGKGEYHAELLHDEATHTVTVHILDASGKKEVIAGGTKVVLQVFRDGEFVSHTLSAAGGEGAASEFSIVDEGLCDLLLHSPDLKGRLTATINGQDYTGIIAHEAHGHAGHDHAGHQHE